MTNATALRGGQVSSDDTANFLKVYSGEVLTAYDEHNISMEYVNVRNIASGKSAQFPVTWKLTASEHTPGVELTGQTSEVNEVVIAITKMLVADAFIPEIDEAMTHYEYRSIYSNQAGMALANAMDSRNFRAAALAARASTLITGGNGGTQVTGMTATSSSDLADGFFSSAQTFVENDIPLDGAIGVLRPAQYFLLPRDTTIVNKDYDGDGSYSKGNVKMIANIPIRYSNNVPSTNVSTGVAALRGDFSSTLGTVFHKDAVGVVKLMDISLRMDYDFRRLGHWIVAKMATGTEPLRPDCAVEFTT